MTHISHAPSVCTCTLFTCKILRTTVKYCNIFVQSDSNLITYISKSCIITYTSTSCIITHTSTSCIIIYTSTSGIIITLVHYSLGSKISCVIIYKQVAYLCSQDSPISCRTEHEYCRISKNSSF